MIRVTWLQDLRGQINFVRRIAYGYCDTYTRDQGVTTSELWHMHLGHVIKQGLQILHNRGALPGIKYCKLDFCKFCTMGRQHRVSFYTSQYKAKGLLDLIHTDVWGPSPEASIAMLSIMSCSQITSPGEFGYTSFRRNQKYFGSQRSEKVWWRITRDERWESWGPTMEVCIPP